MRSLFGTNVFGMVDLTNRVVPVMKGQASGDIVNIASTSGTKGAKGATVYAGSKWAVRGISQCWQAELRPHGIRVMCILPSEVQTNWMGRTGRNNPNKLFAKDIAATIFAEPRHAEERVVAGAGGLREQSLEGRLARRCLAAAGHLEPRRGEPFHRLRQLALVQPGKAESRKRRGAAVEGIAAAGVPRHAAFDTAARPLIEIHFHPEAHPQRHAAGGDREVDVVAKGAP